MEPLRASRRPLASAHSSPPFNCRPADSVTCDSLPPLPLQPFPQSRSSRLPSPCPQPRPSPPVLSAVPAGALGKIGFERANIPPAPFTISLIRPTLVAPLPHFVGFVFSNPGFVFADPGFVFSNRTRSVESGPAHLPPLFCSIQAEITPLHPGRPLPQSQNGTWLRFFVSCIFPPAPRIAYPALKHLYL